MPYVDEASKESVRHIGPRTAGQLNWWITMTILEYAFEEKLSYQRINDVMGVLESAKAEFYRRIAVPYEQQKIVQNGDVYHQERQYDNW